MTMKRGGAAVKERAELRAAIARVLGVQSSLCEDCCTISFRIEFNSGHRRYRAVILHLASCPCLYSRQSKMACDDFLRDALAESGHFLSDYGDRDVAGLHRAIPESR